LRRNKQQGLPLVHVAAIFGAGVQARKQGRTRSEQITFFKSVGVAVQDAAAADLALRNVQGLGQQVRW